MNSIAVTAENFSAHDKRLNTLDRRVTKIETTMTTITPHLATKADVKEAMNTQLRWMIGLFVGTVIGLGTFIYMSQTGMESRLERSMDVRFESVNARFEQVDRRLDQMDRRLDQIDQRLDRVDQRLDRVENRLERVEQVFAPTLPRQTR